jgi:hypothetical protein
LANHVPEIALNNGVAMPALGLDVFDFELSAAEMTAIDGLDTGRRGGPEPDAITLEAFGREIPEP